MDSPEHNRWMERALELARQAAELDEVPVGAVLVANGECLAEGMNLREKNRQAISHAEIEALQNFSKQSKQWRLPPGTSLYVTAEPCLMCAGALLWARVENIYYGCQDPRNAGLRKIQPFIESGVYDHKVTKIEGGLLAEQCSGLMSGYFKKKRN